MNIFYIHIKITSLWGIVSLANDADIEDDYEVGSAPATYYIPKENQKKVLLEDTEVEEDKEELDLKGNKKSLFWLISIFTSTGQFFFGNFFSAFAAEVNISGSLMGFITSIRTLLSSVFQGNIGYLSDKIGRKTLLIVGIAFNFLVTIPLLFFEATWLIVVVAIFQALSLSIFIPTWNAVLGDVTKPENRASFIGKITAIGRLISVSFSLIIAVVFYLADEVYKGWIILGWEVNIPWRAQYSAAFAIAALNSLISVVLLFNLKETKPDTETLTRPKMRVVFKDRNFVKFVIFYTLFGFSMSFVWPLNPIIQINALNLQFYQVAIISSAFIFVMSFVQVFAGKFGDKIGRKPLVILGAFILVFYPISNLPALYSGNWYWLIVTNAFAGIGTGTFFISLNALTLDLAPNDLMGAYSGIREMFFGAAAFIGSLVSGFIIDALEVRYEITVTAIIMCIGITILRFLASIGFLFVTESLPKEVREQRIFDQKNGKQKMKGK